MGAVTTKTRIRTASKRDTTRRLTTIGVIESEPVKTKPARRERRTMHAFKVDADPRTFSDSCIVCGYGETGHLGLTKPERDLIVALMNQPKAQPVMRRSILRKLMAPVRHVGRPHAVAID